MTTFRAYIDTVATLTEVQKDICTTLFESCQTMIQQASRKSAAVSLGNVSMVLYKLMSLVHSYKELEGHDKKEIVVYTLVGGLTANGIHVSPNEQAMIEEAIDVIWFAANEVVFPKLREGCVKCLAKCRK